VHLFLIIGQTNIGIQSPEQFCSSERTPNPPSEELARLTVLGLGVPSCTMEELNISPKHLGITSKTDLGEPSSTEIEVNNSLEHLGITSHTDPDESSSKDFDLNLTIEEYNEMVEKNKKMKITI